MACLYLLKFTILASALICSVLAAGIPEVEAEKLASSTEILHNDLIILTCDAEVVNLPSNSHVTQVELSRKLTGSKTPEETIATYAGSRLSIGANYQDDKKWKIISHGVDAPNNSGSYFMQALVNNTQCSDGGDYYCLVTYKDKGSGDEKQIKGHLNLPSAAEISDFDIEGRDSDGRDIFKYKINRYDTLTIDCYVKGPKELELTWQRDEKVIGLDISLPEVKKVESHQPTLLTGDKGCEQYQFHSTIVFQAITGKTYQCKYEFGSRSRSHNIYIDIKAKEIENPDSDDDVDEDYDYASTSKETDNSWNRPYIIGPIVGVVALCAIAGAAVYVKRHFFNQPVHSTSSPDNSNKGSSLVVIVA